MEALPIDNTYQVGPKATNYLKWAKNVVRTFQKLASFVRIDRLI